LKNAGLSHIKVQRTPLGEKIIVHTSRPGLVVGRKGQNIKQLTKTLKKEFELENPQIEIAEVENRGLNASIMAESIAGYLEKFGTKNFKGIGHKIMTEVMGAGALGVEIVLSGKIPSSRAKSWRFYSGYLRKCGDISIEGIDKAYAIAQLKSGIVGIKLAIMPPDIKLPDDIKLLEEKKEVIEEVKEGEEEKKKEEKGETQENKFSRLGRAQSHQAKPEISQAKLETKEKEEKEQRIKLSKNEKGLEKSKTFQKDSPTSKSKDFEENVKEDKNENKGNKVNG